MNTETRPVSPTAIILGLATQCGPKRTRHAVLTPLCTLCVLGGEHALADIDPVSGIDFVTVGAVGNAPWAGDGSPNDWAVGRGDVNYEYRIGRFEVTTAQWAEFFNAARARSDVIPHVQNPTVWGAAVDPTYGGPGERWIVQPGNEMLAVGGISWRTAAIYANWLHNGKSLEREAFLTGAYDTSTFVYVAGQFQDQFTRSPGARYFIPTWDETLKAFHYDPNKHNADGTTGGWWIRPNGQDAPLVYGFPPAFGGDGTAQAMSGFPFDFNAFNVPLGSYPTVQSPWGLFDAAGMTSEWTEEVLQDDGGHRSRLLEGSDWGGGLAGDRVHYPGGGEAPSVPSVDYGFRIAAAVPAPGAGALVVGITMFIARRKRGDASCGTYPASAGASSSACCW